MVATFTLAKYVVATFTLAKYLQCLCVVISSITDNRFMRNNYNAPTPTHLALQTPTPVTHIAHTAQYIYTY